MSEFAYRIARPPCVTLPSKGSRLHNKARGSGTLKCELFLQFHTLNGTLLLPNGLFISNNVFEGLRRLS